MNFINDMDNFNFNYLYIKKIIKKAVKNNLIIKNNIMLLDESFIIKIIPKLKHPITKTKQIKPNNDYQEAEFYKDLTKLLIKTNKTPHIVGLFKRYLIEDIKILFPKKCFEQKQNDNNNKLCLIKDEYDNKIIEKKASILILEHCPDTIQGQLEKILNKKIDVFDIFINRVIFQVIFTLNVIQQTYPNFTHNDLSLSNIFAINDITNDNNDYVEYNFNNIHYYLPANGIYIKINNFGHSLKQSLKQNTNLSDISTFLTDLYQTLKQTIINNIKNTNLQNTFNAKLKKIIDNFLNNKNIKAPNDYFKLNLFNKLTKLPNNIDVRIIKIYN
jgi:hypothetical protein